MLLKQLLKLLVYISRYLADTFVKPSCIHLFLMVLITDIQYYTVNI